MNPMEFAETIIKMPTEKQNEFFENLKSQLSEEDLQTVMGFISLHSVFINPAKYNAMKNAVRDALCEEIYGHTVESQRQTEDQVLINMYCNSIL